MISSLQIALKNAIDVIVPPATPIQDFTYYWKQLMNFYINHLNESTLPVETTHIPRYLDNLLELLLEEEKHSNEPGPCLEYLLQNRLLDLLVTLAGAETPPGMRLVCLIFLRKLLTRSKHPLLHHAAVYGPIQKMIAMCNGSLASPIENEEIHFLLSLCYLVCKYPHVTSIVNDSSNVSYDTGILQFNAEKSEVEQITYIPAWKMKDVNPLFKPLNTHAITLVNPDLFKSGKDHSIHSESTDKSSTPSEEIKENKPSKHKHNASIRSNSSSQSSGSSKETELSASSSPFTNKNSENFQNSVLDNVRIREIENSYKESEADQLPELDPVLVALNDLKELKLDEECESANNEVRFRNSKHDITFNNLGSPEHSKCLLLDSLKTYVNSADSTVRIRACEGIMVLASLDDQVFVEIVAKSDLLAVLARRLEILFNAIPAHVEPCEIEEIDVTWGLDSPPLTDELKFPGCRKVAAFFMWLDYCAQLSREAHPDVAEVLAQNIRVLFFEKALTPALSAHHAVLITALITKCLKQIQPSPLSIEMSRWLVGQQREPDILDVCCWPVVHRLIENCCTESDDLTIETLKLFEEMIEKKDEHILHCLVLRYLNTRGYYDNSAADSAIASWSDEEDEREREREREKKSSVDFSLGSSHSRTLAPSNIHRILNCFLSLVPRQLQSESNSNYGRYMEDWEKQYSLVVKNCALLAWPLEAVTIEDSNSYDSRTDLDNSSRFYSGSFLAMLLDKVGNIPKQKYDTNLQLTLLLTKLALLPHPYLHEFLLNPLIPLTPGQKSLFICLQRVVKQLINEVPKIPNYKQALKETRLRLFNDCCTVDSSNAETDSNAKSKEKDQLLESVIVVEEFCKELAAIAYVKYHHST